MHRPITNIRHTGSSAYIQTIKIIRLATGLGLGTAKEAVDDAHLSPSKIASEADPKTVGSLVESLARIGVRAEIRSADERQEAR